MKRTVTVLLFASIALAQPWSAVLDSSRAIDWTSAGFSIPAYSVPCSTQPSLLTGSGNASANTTAIEAALASCDATHNVVNIPAGTYYVAGFTYGSQGKQVVRGAGPNATDLIFTAYAGCAGLGHGACMLAGNWTYTGDTQVLTGNRQCLWSAGYAQGTTSITLSSCGGTPPVNSTIVLDQADDATDTGGVFLCDQNTNSNCTYESGVNSGGRLVAGVYHGLMQTVYVTGVTSLGGGSYTVTISPGVYSTNIRTGQNPGAWWPGFVQLDGIENMSLDGNSLGNSGGILSMFSCYQCWAKNIRFISGDRNSVLVFQSLQSVIRDSYFFGAQSHASTSYNIESDISSGLLVENNIMHQVTTAITLNNGCTGCVIGYNFSIKTIFANGTWAWPMFASHTTGNDFNLFEGNSATGVAADNASGPSDQFTIFRNILTGWQTGNTNATVPFLHRALVRNVNFLGNVLGQPSYHTQYQTYATSTSAGVGAANEYQSIYDFGWGGTGPTCTFVSDQSNICDPVTFTTAMRWGNYDVVNAATRWDSTEASPPAVSYVNANFSSGYFGGLAHTLPASFYYASKPSWWPVSKAWPPIGPDVSSGNVGICSGGTYDQVQATSSGQCTGGSLSTAWASHTTSIPAMDCYLNTMGGPPDGSGSILAFDATTCYAQASTGGSIMGGLATFGGLRKSSSPLTPGTDVQVSYNGGSGIATGTLTTSGTNILCAFVAVYAAGAAPTSITCGGVTMTAVGTAHAYTVLGGDFVQFFFAVGITPGSTVISATSTGDLLGWAMYWTHAKQTGQPDAVFAYSSAGVTDGSNEAPLNGTTVADKSAIMGLFASSLVMSTSPSTNGTFVGAIQFGDGYFWRSTNTVTPAGATTLKAKTSNTPGTPFEAMGFSIAPE